MTMQKELSGIIKLIFSMLLFQQLYAVDTSVSASGSVSYNSNLINDDIRERIAAYNKKTSAIQKSMFLNASASAGFSWGNEDESVYFADYAADIFFATELPQFSRISQRMTFSILHQIDTHYSINLFLLLHQESKIKDQHEDMVNNGFIPIYGDGTAAAEIFYDMAGKYAWYGRVKGGYFKETHYAYQYLSGPEIGAETGWYLYPSETLTLKAALGSDLFSFRDIVILCQKGDITLRNRYMTFFVPIEAKIKKGRVTFKAAGQYSFSFWLQPDVAYEKEKRRTEHLLQAQPQILYSFTDRLSARADYSFRKNISSIGSDSADYMNFSYTQHVVSLSLSYEQ